ncbi:hypothetical protein [Streptomyces longispororuber]|uniref:hypothetical protein n=1 Tax=Streptomyces longispororuber TaxID=68230 RepID=UPI00210EBDAC|nr:hypothetical protein [Streptomyces longispororuber]MCQ4213382.1 hypothetical protein [Streptomyces longispororuber]
MAIEMTEPLAATLAAVAPVIVLVGVVEMDLRYKLVRDAASDSTRPFLNALASIPDNPTTVEEIEGLRRGITEAQAAMAAGPTKVKVLKGAWSMGFVWSLLVLALTAVEAFSLVWLGKPDHHPVPLGAGLCVIAVSLGMLWVVAVPLLRLANAPLEPLWRLIAEVRRIERLQRTHNRTSQPDR